jgi:hypothetical protein
VIRLRKDSMTRSIGCNTSDDSTPYWKECHCDIYGNLMYKRDLEVVPAAVLTHSFDISWHTLLHYFIGFTQSLSLTEDPFFDFRELETWAREHPSSHRRLSYGVVNHLYLQTSNAKLHSFLNRVRGLHLIQFVFVFALIFLHVDRRKTINSVPPPPELSDDDPFSFPLCRYDGNSGLMQKRPCLVHSQIDNKYDSFEQWLLASIWNRKEQTDTDILPESPYGNFVLAV